jgi:antitoxin (DNA-binding transcriptional repressor) of toxin-antitoxin stability system
MRSVPLKTFQAEVSEYVHQAESGETILILRQDRVVAELTPPRQQSALEARDAFLENAVKKGWITPARVVSDEPPPRLPVAPLRDLLRELDEDRADR